MFFSDACAPDPCQNNATCMNLVDDFKCNCTEGYIGKTCNNTGNETQLFSSQRCHIIVATVTTSQHCHNIVPMLLHDCNVMN